MPKIFSRKLISQRRLFLIIAIAAMVIVCPFGVFFSRTALTGEMLRYPNAIPFNKGCGGRSFGQFKKWWMATFTQCYATTDTPSQVEDWYRARGWYYNGERLIFPIWTFRQTTFEGGKQFSTSLLPDGKTLIVQETLYRAGPCVWNCP